MKANNGHDHAADITCNGEVVGHFRVGDKEHLILVLGGKGAALDATLASTSLLEVCQFNVMNQRCAVVQHGLDHGSEPALSLTARELQIASFVAIGCPNKQIASRLHISEWTVATYLRRIFSKLGVDSRAAMIYKCAPFLALEQ
ncbi:MAG: LuxR C-terminal-related transcriptional regulator [Gammaproteobacteria bacterium]